MIHKTNLWFFMVLSMFLAIICFAAPVKAETIDSGECGTGVTYTLDAEGVLRIEGSGSIRNSAFRKDYPVYYQHASDIKKVIIEEGIMGIGEAAFSRCYYIESVEMAQDVTQIGRLAFSDCCRLKTVTIKGKLIEIGELAFAFNNSLEEIPLPDTVTTIGNKAFYGCISLKEISIPKGVTEIREGTFQQCENLKKISLPSGLKEIGPHAFHGCVSLDGDVLPEQLTTIGEAAFYGCISLSKISIPAGVTTIPKSAFCYCKGCKSLTMTGNTKYIYGSAFAQCSSLTRVTFPEGVKQILTYTFSDCTSLKRVDIPLSVTHIYGYPFENCSALTDIYYAGTKTQWKKINYVSSMGFPTTAKLHCKTEVTSVKISGPSKKIAKGKKVKLTATILPKNATNKSVLWKTSNSKTATVTSAGTVTIRKNPAKTWVTITAAAKDGSGKKATYVIKVMKGVVKKITLKNKVSSLKAGTKIRLHTKVKATAGANKKLKWSSSNKKWATVNSAGVVKTLAKGKGHTVKITAAATDGSKVKKTISIKIR